MEEKILLYMTIHQLCEKRLRVAQIARQLNISRNTVYKYLNMTFEDALNEFGELKGKKKLYRVQIGAYSVKRNADKQLAKAKKAGFKDAFVKYE